MTDSEFVVNHIAKTYHFPDWLVRSFKDTENPRYEKLYYAPYNQLLNEHFKGRDGFRVCPVMYPVDNRESIDFTVYFEVYISVLRSPVFILEIKRPQGLNDTSERIDANIQMRRRYVSLLDKCAIDKLYGVVAFGTKLAFYDANKLSRLVTPPVILQSNPNIIEDLAPASRWDNNDILNPRCAYKLWVVFDEIHRLCRNMRD